MGEERIKAIKEKFLEMFDYINITCKNSREKSLAITKLEEAEFWATKSIEKE